MKLSLITAALVLAGAASTAQAQMTPPACDGHYEVIRTDTVKPGKLDVFMKAVHDHQAWYATHGMPDHILIGRVLARDPGPDGFSATQAMTIHTDGTSHAPPHENDPTWDAYVAEYDASSTVVSQAVVCVAQVR